MEKTATYRVDAIMPDNEKVKIVSLTYVIGLATQEKWDEVDVLLPAAAQQLDFFGWAEGNLKCLDLNLRDLAASILQYTELDTNNPRLLSKGLITGLFEAMNDIKASESNPFPSFRAACALAKRYSVENIDGRRDEIETILQGFVDDEDVSVSETAKYYLRLLYLEVETSTEAE